MSSTLILSRCYFINYLFLNNNSYGSSDFRIGQDPARHSGEGRNLLNASHDCAHLILACARMMGSRHDQNVISTPITAEISLRLLIGTAAQRSTFLLSDQFTRGPQPTRVSP